MAVSAEVQRLLAVYEVQDKSAAGVASAVGGMHKLETSFGRIGGIAQKGVATAARNIQRIGILAAGGIATQVFAGIRSLEDMETANNQTAAAIKSTGGIAGITLQRIRDLASAEEDLTTVDDKVVQSGENMLLTFTGIHRDVFPRATKAMVDMAVAMNSGNVEGIDLKGTAIQLGKALNDPLKGLTALSKVGVSFTKQQQEQIKTFVKHGEVAKAQGVILAELEKEFGKAGEAAGKGTSADFRRFQDAVESAQQALAVGFLPVISKVSRLLQTELAKPEVLARIRGFGDSLAGAFDQLVDVAGRVPWSKIGDSLRIAGGAAKGLLDVFTGMPAWVQTAVVSGWGLNKLTGGAVGSIVGELGKGLIKGVLGMNAGVVNLNAGVVNGAGGVGAAGGKGGGIGVMGFLGLATIGLTVAEVLHELGVDKPVQDFANQYKSGAVQTDAEGNAVTKRVGPSIVASINAMKTEDASHARNIAHGIDKMGLKLSTANRNLDRIANKKTNVHITIPVNNNIRAVISGNNAYHTTTINGVVTPLDL